MVPFPRGSYSRPETDGAGAGPGWGSCAGDVPAVLGWVLLSCPSAAATLFFLLDVKRGFQPVSPPCPTPNDWEEP